MFVRVRTAASVAAALVLAATLALAVAAGPLAAQEHGHEHEEEHGEQATEHHEHEAEHRGGHHHEGLHFTHPIITESVSPDTKLRLDHRFFDFPDGDVEHSAQLTGEFAFSRIFSVEAGIPYSYSATAFGNADITFKFANYGLEEAGIVLGYGLELELPTNGSPEEATPDIEHEHEHGVALRRGAPRVLRRSGGILTDPPAPRFHGAGGVEGTLGTEEWTASPFLNLGFRRGGLELIGWGAFAIPFHQADQAEVGTGFEWNLSALYHVSPRLDAMLELDASHGISGEPVGEDVVDLSPGVRFRLFPDRPFVLGTSVGFPVASGMEEDPFDLRWVTSLFWHF